MSFDIAFMSCRTNGTEQKTNPVTGEMFAAPIAGPLTPKEQQAVEKLLTDHQYDAGLVRLSDGQELEVGLDDDLTGGMIFLREAAPAVFTFLFQFADAGSYVLCPIMEDNPAIVTKTKTSTSASKAQILEPDADIHVAGNPHEIAEIIGPALGDWEAYGDQAIGE